MKYVLILALLLTAAYAQISYGGIERPGATEYSETGESIPVRPQTEFMILTIGISAFCVIAALIVLGHRQAQHLHNARPKVSTDTTISTSALDVLSASKTRELLSYVERCRERQLSNEQIRERLTSVGWDEKFIDAILLH